MRAATLWVRLVSVVVPADERADWREEWEGELAANDQPMKHAWGALADAWYLRTEGWTMDAFLRDVRMAARSLWRRPAFMVIGGLTLAVGIGATTAIYSIVDAVLVDPLPLPHPERVVSYNHDAPNLGVNVPLVPLSEGMYLQYAEQARAIESLALLDQLNVSMMTGEEPVEVPAAAVTDTYFRVAGLEPVLGRGFVEGEDAPGAEPVVVLSRALWEQTFGADRAIVGRLVDIEGVQRRVVGVMPGRFAIGDEQLWIPMTIDRAAPDLGSLGHIGIARLAEGRTMEAANAEMQGLLATYAENTDGMREMIDQAGLKADVRPLKSVFSRDLKQPLLILLGMVGFVLVIACANVANLFLVHAEARQRESAVRTAMGASRLDVVRQYLSESVALALAGGALGLVLASFGIKGLLRLAPAEIPRSLDIGIDGSVVAFAVVVSVVAGLLFGLLPALGYGRTAISQVLREGGRSATTGRERHRVRSSLVVGQVALALVLLVGSGLMLRSFAALQHVDLGFRPEGLLTFRYSLPASRYGDGPARMAFHRDLLDRIEATPGVVSAGVISGLPLTQAKSATPMEAVDRPVPSGSLAPVIEQRQVSPDYFATMGIDIVDGRPLGWDDRADGLRGIVISEALARAFWPGESAVGHMIRSQGEENDAWEVVGVARDVRFDGVDDEPLPLAYWPLLNGDVDEAGSSPSAVDVVVRSAGGDPLDVLDGVRAALRGLDPRLPIINPRTVGDVVDDALSGASFTALLLGIAAAVALLLGTVGLYGVISFIVGRRTQEIGVRMALGASTRSVLRQVVRQGMTLALIGLVVGLAGAWAVGRILASLLYGVSSSDPVTFIGTALLLGLVSFVATWVPAYRAAHVDPVEALRSD